MKKGKVYLVGAGPYDKGLLTLRAREVIKKADVVLYDYLVSKDVLKFIKPGVNKVCFAKDNKKDFRLQGKINNFLVKNSLAGKKVVRLKGGDPFIFSRGIEELESLVENDIPFEVVPGITAGLAACVYSLIPVTRRNLVSSVILATGSEVKNEKSNINWVSLAKSGATLIFYMAVARIPKISFNLVKRGLSKDTPCALIQDATSYKQRIVIGKLSNISLLARQRKVKPPAIFVISRTILLRNRFVSENLALAGKKVVVTREDPAYLGELLKKEKSQIIHFPTIKTVSHKYSIKDLHIYDWVLFLSVNAVRRFRRYLRKIPNSAKIACIGVRTAEYLKQLGYKVDLVPEEFSSQGLIKALRKRQLNKKNVLIVRSKKGNDLLKKALCKKVNMLKEIYVYDIIPGSPDKRMFFRQVSKGADIFTFLSAQSADNFVNILGKNKAKLLVRQGLVASIGPETSKRLKQLGIGVDFQPKVYTINSFVNGLKQAIRKRW